jgi:HNH endonuclease
VAPRIGTRVNYWTVTAPAPSQSGRTFWRCRCICGVERTIRERDLLAEKTRSCGCRTRTEFHDRLAECRRGPTECWIWTGAAAGPYGVVMLKGRIQKAHRAVYEHLIGPIPKGLTLDHLCRVTLCVNPRHMEPVTGRVNTLRGDNPAATNAHKTQCKRGHPFTPANTYIQPSGGRSCRTCSRDRMRVYRTNLRSQGRT